jgi:EAL domain-containing protein (putative c-di-GMP-specific phosphodiesterase class I)
VDLAARQLGDESIVDDVARVLEQTGLPPELLQLELAESALLDADDRPLPVLQRLAGLGVRLAVDGFGTGYAGLAYLRGLPVHTVKLAGPVLAGLREGPPVDREARVLDALVRLGRALGVTVAAEAVETDHQAAVLRILGCDAAQGWYYGAAASADRVRELLASGGPT